MRKYSAPIIVGTALLILVCVYVYVFVAYLP